MPIYTKRTLEWKRKSSNDKQKRSKNEQKTSKKNFAFASVFVQCKLALRQARAFTDFKVLSSNLTVLYIGPRLLSRVADGCGAGEELVRMGDESVCMPCMKGFVREDLQNQMCVACSDPLYTTREEGRVNPNHHDNEAEDCVVRESNNPFSWVIRLRLNSFNVTKCRVAREKLRTTWPF